MNVTPLSNQIFRIRRTEAQQCDGNILSLSMQWRQWQWFPNRFIYSHTFLPQPVTEFRAAFCSTTKCFVTSVGVLKVHNHHLNTFSLFQPFPQQMRLILEVICRNMFTGQEELYCSLSQPDNSGCRLLHPYLLRLCPNKFHSGIWPLEGKL